MVPQMIKKKFSSIAADVINLEIKALQKLKKMPPPGQRVSCAIHECKLLKEL